MLRMGLQKSFGDITNYNNFYANVEAQNNPIKIELLHKAKIEMDEVGSTAAAVTTFRLVKSKADPHVMDNIAFFICNHPFVFLIHDKRFEEILFNGVFRGSI